MPGFRVTINGKELVAVSVDGLNILSVQIHGDVIGDELAELQVFGGHYSGNETDTHLIWVNEHRINEKDEIEIIFSESVTTSYPGKTIEELSPKLEEQMGPWQPIEEMFSELSNEPRVRDHFSFILLPPSGEPIHAKTNNNEFSFNCSVMWKWLHPENASIWLTSNTLHGIKERKSGVSHAKLSLQYEQSIKLNVST